MPGEPKKLLSLNARTMGEFSLVEFKNSIIFKVNASQSNLFRLKNRIVRTSVADIRSDPGVAEPVVVAENLVLLIGKA